MRAELEDVRAESINGQQKFDDMKLAHSAVTEGIWLCKLVNGDPDHKESEIIWSKQFRKLLGYEKVNDFPNQWNSWVSAVHEDDIDSAYKAFSNHLNDKTGNTAYVVEYRLNTCDRGYVWFRERASTLRNEYGLALVTAGAIRDISDEYAARELHELGIKRTNENMHNILDVIETVNEVATQLTILSMNATIEAARAGDKGKAFAVVAGEVRKLADFTAKAMSDMRKMAESS